MKSFMFFSALFALANSNPEAGYSYPSFADSQIDISSQYPELSNQQNELGINGYGGVLNNVNEKFQERGRKYKTTSEIIKSISNVPTIHKHTYIHVAPEDPEEVVYHKPIIVPQPQKHYKLIFVKAPTPPKPTAPIIPVQPQNEEKTLVYVLVKKPEAPKDIIIPTAAPTIPSKPEVYYIKYKSQKKLDLVNKKASNIGAPTFYKSALKAPSGFSLPPKYGLPSA